MSDSDTNFALAFKYGACAMCITSIEDGRFIDVNDVFLDNLGYKREEIIGRTSADINLWVDLADRDALLRELTQNAKVTEFQTHFRDKKGNNHLGLTSAVVIKMEGKPYLLAQTVTRTLNISELRLAENHVRKREAQYRLLADNITEHVWLRDINSLKIIYISPSVEKMYGYSLSEVSNLSLKKLLTKESFQDMVDKFITEMPKALATLPPAIHKYSFETQAYNKAGHLLWMDNTVSFLRDDNGNLSLLLGETRDITERKLTEIKLQQTLASLKRAIGTTIQVLVSVSEARDPYTAGHQSRSADIATAIAAEMGFPEDKIEGVKMASIIHDIGKLTVPSEILTKPTKLTNLEFSLIKEHSQSGYEMLKDVESPWPLAQIVHQHHERINGTGYPKKLKGDEILMEARILAVADVIEAMASNRPYRPSLGIATALEEIEKNKGILYDGIVAEACLRLFREKGYQLT